MLDHDSNLDPNRIAAVLYRPEDDVDTLLADIAIGLARRGVRVGGIVQRNIKGTGDCRTGMLVHDLLDDSTVSICQSLGAGASGCRLDASGLAEAAMSINRAIAARVDLVVINKFSKQEASGKGLRDEFAAAILAGIPVLTAVPEKCLGDWNTFTGDRGTTLLCAGHAIEGWWSDLAPRLARSTRSAANRAA